MPIARAHRQEGDVGEVEYKVVEQVEGAVAEGRQAAHDARQATLALLKRHTQHQDSPGVARQAPLGMPGKPSKDPTQETGDRDGGSGRPLRHQYRRRLPSPQELELERMGQHREGRSFFPMMKPVTTAQRIDPVEGFSKTRPAKGRQTAK